MKTLSLLKSSGARNESSYGQENSAPLEGGRLEYLVTFVQV
jgi:hypothetical protein